MRSSDSPDAVKVRIIASAFPKRQADKPSPRRTEEALLIGKLRFRRREDGRRHLEQSNRGNGDTTSETDVDVCTTRALTRMIDAVVEQPATFLMPIT